MNEVIINKVSVIKEFPGANVGDIFEINQDGLFDYTYNSFNNEEDNAVEAIYGQLTVHKPTLSKSDVISNLGTFFVDISEFKMKSREWIEDRIAELKGYITKIDEDNKEGLVSKDVNISEAKTVWQNNIWELETVLGKRTLYRSDL